MEPGTALAGPALGQLRFHPSYSSCSACYSCPRAAVVDAISFGGDPWLNFAISGVKEL